MEMDVYESSASKEDDVAERSGIQETLNDADAVSTEMQVECASYPGDEMKVDDHRASNNLREICCNVKPKVG